MRNISELPHNSPVPKILHDTMDMVLVLGLITVIILWLVGKL